ncbi:MAG TPA: endonuclease/exonuclease/phosphatase family protein [Candidatus Sumerlaeota bacterium]|nr:MAG: Endonuclease/Exonuclease/phosphatase family protein [candidate division BRC1 bacterium ADurb.Bin183]HOE63856.1 endonuclease/exonuclease/phosphatase family protein [Candidatus Sumerlaeota bacterium]HRR31007.1 endonuclease/exonuclease/phosphatase family protein [Candidatus Sumerlaeia bacterium]HON49960.1 endonuclease/exonuclease/phosphatase family protein [Candidatus Sumerlaeota bacterium]HOR63792.1 endonuclease/exonuclease/phosphatase family protein [Candidatus Sumerlaeota bacterium]
MQKFPNWVFNQFLFWVLWLIAACSFADSLPIKIDGLFSDWGNLLPQYEDPVGDNGKSPIDFRNLYIANDDNFLFIRFDTSAELILNLDNSIVLYIDWDGQPATGYKIAGIGADVKWEFGARRGTVYSGNSTLTVRPSALGLLQSPGVSANEYEIALSLFPEHKIRLGKTISLLLRNEASSGLDTMPDSGATAYSIALDSPPSFCSIPLAREMADDIRIVTYNAHRDSLFSRMQYYSRILRAINPDIINIQETYNHTAAETAELIEQILPSATNGSWHAAQVNDCITVSRFPILETYYSDGNLVAVLSAPKCLGAEKLLLFNVHFPCCEFDAQRQRESDKIMSFIRDAKAPGGLLTVPDNTPIIFTGDTNFVGWAQQLRTILSGDIVDEERFGADFKPDWDGSDFADCLSYHNSNRVSSYTWRSDSSYYCPSRMDYIIYSDSVLELGNHFILWTSDMAAADLDYYGLQAGDVSSASDHLPHVADFRARKPKAVWTVY